LTDGGFSCFDASSAVASGHGEVSVRLAALAADNGTAEERQGRK